MTYRRMVVMLVAIIVLMESTLFAKDLTFGVLSKSLDDQNFIDVMKGCQQAARKNGDTCVHIGGEGPANPRQQVAALQNAVRTRKLSAIAISVVMSDLLADVVRKIVRVPVITFDSPFAPADASLSSAYVGTDNISFGRDLAKIAEQFRPQGGTLCIMRDMHDTNLEQRVWGVRQELSGNYEIPDGQRLNGENGWTESERCPLNSGDDRIRAMNELTYTLGTIEPDVFLSVGQWPIVSPARYRTTVAPFYGDIEKKKRIMVFAIGRLFPEHVELMKEGLVHGLVSINFPEIGRQSYKVMREIVENRSVPPCTYIPSRTLVGRMLQEKQ